jgi:predicted DNA-binding protein
LPQPRLSRILKGMEVHLTPETEKKLKDLAAESGRGTDDLLEDAVVGYFDELSQVREMLDRRYDEMQSGKVEGIDGEEAYQRLMEKTQVRRQPPSQ